MQDIFEKIIEKLEVEADSANDKIMEQETEKDMAYYDGYDDGCSKAIEIVKQEAEQFGCDTNVLSNGWIPCNELLPAYGQTVLASVCAEDAEWKIIIACYKEEDFWLDGKIDAWQPLPQPYTKGEHDENTK